MTTVAMTRIELMMMGTVMTRIELRHALHVLLPQGLAYILDGGHQAARSMQSHVAEPSYHRDVVRSTGVCNGD